MPGHCTGVYQENVRLASCRAGFHEPAKVYCSHLETQSSCRRRLKAIRLPHESPINGAECPILFGNSPVYGAFHQASREAFSLRRQQSTAHPGLDAHQGTGAWTGDA